MWGVQKYQNHYEIPFRKGCIDLKNLAVLLLLAQGKSDTFSLFEDFNMARYKLDFSGRQNKRQLDFKRQNENDRFFI